MNPFEDFVYDSRISCDVVEWMAPRENLPGCGSDIFQWVETYAHLEDRHSDCVNICALGRKLF